MTLVRKISNFLCYGLWTPCQHGWEPMSEDIFNQYCPKCGALRW